MPTGLIVSLAIIALLLLIHWMSVIYEAAREMRAYYRRLNAERES